MRLLNPTEQRLALSRAGNTARLLGAIVTAGVLLQACCPFSLNREFREISDHGIVSVMLILLPAVCGLALFSYSEPMERRSLWAAIAILVAAGFTALTSGGLVVLGALAFWYRSLEGPIACTMTPVVLSVFGLAVATIVRAVQAVHAIRSGSVADGPGGFEVVIAVPNAKASREGDSDDPPKPYRGPDSM